MSGHILGRLAVVVLVALAGCSSHRPVVAPSPSPAATATPLPSASPLAAKSSVPSAAPVRTPSPTPSPTPAPTMVLAPDAQPKILDVTLSTTTFVGGDVISGTVRTSSNVASVEARIATYGIGVPKTGVGRFSLSYQVPNVPFFLHGDYMMQFIARNADGARTERDIPISIR